VSLLVFHISDQTGRQETNMEGKNLAVHRTRMVELQGRQCVPTALLYEQNSSRPKFGFDALANATTPALLNENFKLQVGNINPDNEVLNRKRFRCADQQGRSAMHLTTDFFGCLLDAANSWLDNENYARSTHILISEPLQFHAEDAKDWLQYYRKNVKKILNARFSEIEFLPEPFAVFQYYRYGMKHEYLTKQKKYRALVIDFGGGTFDTSIVETTKDGKISEGGRHSRPKSAASVPIGGFYINEVIASRIAKQTFPNNVDDIRKGIANYKRWTTDDFDIEMLAPRNRSCVMAYADLLQQVESAKIELCSKIRDWDLTAKLHQKVKLKIKSNIFDYDSATKDIDFTADEFRDLFINEIWNRQIRRPVADAFKRSVEANEGYGVNVVLISGGSANIKWLQHLIKRDFPEEVSSAHVASLQESYQDIVSKGLAIENVRRNLPKTPQQDVKEAPHDSEETQQGTEFQNVTYNPIALMLSPDAKGFQEKRFQCVSEEGLNPTDAPGVLIASASQLTNLLEQTVEWKVRLDSPPKQFLDYYFLRRRVDAGLKPDEVPTEDRYNFVERRIHTKPSAKFDSKLRIQVTFCRDGTCKPIFIYKTTRGEATDYSQGVPFFLDAVLTARHTTDDSDHVPDQHTQTGTAFLGLDFGSSNTSISYVTSADVEELDDSTANVEWLELGELASALPDMAASSLREFIAARQTDDSWVSKCIKAIENQLCLVAYLLAAECFREGAAANSNALCNYITRGKRSMGPLRGLIRELAASRKFNGPTASAVKGLSQAIWENIDLVIEKLNHAKHDKHDKGELAQDRNVNSAICQLGNVLQKILSGKYIGYFEDVRKQGFASNKYNGTFRIADNAAPYYVSGFLHPHSPDW
jgi:hypothetical protein